ncbi:MAG: hypothetical protein ACRDJC_08805 [Thermomicrobiales bacterium]
MRVRNAGAAARLLLVMVLMAGTVVSGMPPAGAPGGPSSDTAAVQAKDKDQGQRKDKDKPKSKNKNKQAKGEQKANDGSKSDKGKNTGDNGKGKKNGNGNGKGKGKPRRGKRPPAPLDAERIAAEKAESVDALECGDLIAIRVDGRVYCTHGEDPEAPGAGTGHEDDIVSAESVSGPAARALCVDDGHSGPRVQVVYVHRGDRPNRLGELLPTFRRLASEMDTVFDQSARKTGGSLRVRYVTDANCKADVKTLMVPPRALEGFGSLIQKMHEAGHDQIDRKYLMMVDDRIFCGVGTYAGGSKADDVNTEAHDFTGYARVDLPCWDAGSMAHELSHTLGAVQNSAPHTSRGGHCIDEWDVMCYSDEPFKPKMKFLCEDGANDFRLDCGNDDYFAARPANGSYLDRHWNMADSHFLAEGSGPDCVDAGLEPDDAFWYDYWDVPMPEYPVGESQERAFCVEPGDTDWTLVPVEKGTTYLIETTKLAPGVDTQLVLYRGFKDKGWDGMEEFAVNDDRNAGDPSSAITFTTETDGSFLLGIADANDRAGLNQTYTLSVAETDSTSEPRLSLSRSRAKPGNKFTVNAHDLPPDAVVTFRLRRSGSGSVLGEATTDANGTATESFNVPRGARKGNYRVEATTENRSVADAPLKVDAKSGKKGTGGKGKKSRGHGKGKGNN